MAAKYAKILLFVSNDGVRVYGWQHRVLTLLGSYAATPEGRQAFDGQLAEVGHLPHYVLLDVVEEDFHTETIPHVYGRDRAALLVRKRQQQFRGSHYTNAWLQGREEGGRRDDRILLSGLLTNDLLDGWLDYLLRRHVPLAAVCSMALLSVSVVNRFNPDAEHVLLVTEEGRSGIRQSYFKNGELKFSRLTALQDTDEAELAPKIVAESRRTRQYLASLRLLGREDVVSTLVLCHANNRERLQQQCRSGEGVEFLFMALEDVAKAFRLHYAGPIGVAELLLQLLAKRGWRNHYAPSSRRRHYWLWRAGRWLTLGAVVTLLLGGAIAAWLQQETGSIKDATLALANQRHSAERLKKDNLLPLSDLPPPAVMKQAVDRINLAHQRWPSMSEQLQRLSQLLTRYEALQLAELGWAVSPDESFLSEAVTQGGGMSNGAMPTPDPASAADGTSPAPATKRNELVHLRGSINPFTDNYRFALESIQHFSQEWERENKAKVRLLKLPIDVKSDKTIDLEQLSQGKEQDKTDFELLLVRPLPLGGGQ